MRLLGRLACWDGASYFCWDGCKDEWVSSVVLDWRGKSSEREHYLIVDSLWIFMSCNEKWGICWEIAIIQSIYSSFSCKMTMIWNNLGKPVSIRSTYLYSLYMLRHRVLTYINGFKKLYFVISDFRHLLIHMPTVSRKGDSPTSSTKLFAVWGSHFFGGYMPTPRWMAMFFVSWFSGLLWLTIVLQSRFYSFLSFLSYKKSLTMTPVWCFNRMFGCCQVAEFLAQWVNCAWGAKISLRSHEVDAIQAAEVVKDQSLAAITECAKGGWLWAGVVFCRFLMIFADRERYLGVEHEWEW